MSKHDRVTVYLNNGIEMAVTATKSGGSVSVLMGEPSGPLGARDMTIREHRGDAAKTVLRTVRVPAEALVVAVVNDRPENRVEVVYPEEMAR